MTVEAHTVYDALQLAVSPVILISACGLILLSMTNRLGRAIDRARLLVREGSRDSVEAQVKIIARRAKWIRSAILFVALSIFFVSVLVLVLFLSVYLTFEVQILLAILFTLSLASLIASLGFFIIDIFSSLHAMEADIADLSRR